MSEQSRKPRWLARRAFLRSIGALTLPAATGRLGAANAVTRENERPGSWEWYLTKPSRRREVEGYASKVSVGRDEAFTIHVSVSEAQGVDWTAFRLGYYQGIGARLVTSGLRQPASPQQKFVNVGTGLIDCRWPATFRIVPDIDWPSGLYLIVLRRADGFQSYIPIVVREATQRAPVLFKASVTTWQAYNEWGGASLYNNRGAETGLSGSRAPRASFDRPHLINDGAGMMLSYEAWMVRWLEQQGYDISYATNIDVDANPGLLSDRKIVLSVGHDEYWSNRERDAHEAARDAGVSLAFFSGNTAYWRIRYEGSSNGVERRVMVCYKDPALDPLKDPRETTDLFRSGPRPRPENALMGVMYGGYTVLDAYPQVARQPDHWVFGGTGVKAGETLPNIIGYEWDRYFQDAAAPARVEVVASAGAIGADGEHIPADVAVYYPTASSFVFSAGTIQWSWGLSLEGYADARIQRMTQNVFTRAGVEGGPPIQVPPRPPAREPGSARMTMVVAGGLGPGAVDGQVEEARFNAPAGVAAGPDGTIYVTEVRNHTVRAITPAGMVVTLAGSGPFDSEGAIGFDNGVGTDAHFNRPTGIAVDSKGRIFVSDTGNHIIRMIEPETRRVETFGGRTWTKGHWDAADTMEALFNAPRGLAIGPDDSLYVADSGNGAIRRISEQGVTTIAEGLYSPTGVSVGPDGIIYVIETGTGRVLRIAPSGRIERLAGSGVGDTGGLAATAKLRPIEGILAVDGAVFFSDSANYRVRAVSLGSSSQVTTVVGDGRYGSGSGTGDQTRVVLPRGLAKYNNGFVVADSGNNRIVYVEI